MSIRPFSDPQHANLYVLIRFFLRTAILGFCAVFGTNGFALTFGGLLASAMLCCVFIGALRQEMPLGQTLTHFDEAVAYAAISCLALGTS